MNRLSRLLFLLVLGYSAIQLPHHLKKFSSGDVYVQERQIIDPTHFEGMDAQTKEFAQAAMPNVQVMTNPLMGALVEASQAQKNRARSPRASLPDRGRTWFDDNKDLLVSWLWRVPVGLLSMGIFMMLLGLKGWGRSCVNLCHTLSQLWLFLLSALTALLFITLKVNLFQLAPAAMWNVPVVSTFVCLALFRWIDVNFPLWNSTLSSFMAPVMAGLFVLVVDKWGIQIHKSVPGEL